MESIIPILGVVFFLAYLANKLNKKEDESNSSINRQDDEVVADMHNTQNGEEMKQEQEVAKPDTLGLMFRTLSNLGCQPTRNEDGTLSVLYQGEYFRIEFGGSYARVWDPVWAGVKADDPDMPKIREAVNIANYNFGPTVVLGEPDDDGLIKFHTRRDIMLHPACPDNEPFVKEVLDSFFDAKEAFRRNFHRINDQQKEARKKRRPVGFTANTDSNE